MTKYAALLRGINVGGRQIRMDELKACIEQGGFTNVKTVLRSGNVVFESDSLNAADVRARLQKIVGEQFSYPAIIFVYPLQTIADIVAATPYDKPEKVWHSYIVFVDGPLALAELQTRLDGLDLKIEEATVGDGVLYWTVLVGSTLTSELAKRMARAPLKNSLTTRNIRTLRKMATLLG